MYCMHIKEKVGTPESNFFWKLCRVPNNMHSANKENTPVHLPCVFFSTRQRKNERWMDLLCRVPNGRHTANKTAPAIPNGARMFAVCPTSGTRQRRKLCRVLRFAVFFFSQVHGQRKIFPGVESLPCVFLRGTQQMPSLPCAISFPCAAVRAHGKDPLYRVPEIQHTAKPKAHGKYAQSRSAWTHT